MRFERASRRSAATNSRKWRPTVAIVELRRHGAEREFELDTFPTAVGVFAHDVGVAVGPVSDAVNAESAWQWFFITHLSRTREFLLTVRSLGLREDSLEEEVLDAGAGRVRDLPEVYVEGGRSEGGAVSSMRGRNIVARDILRVVRTP